ncbi:MAG: hypothetical protein H7641_00755 [Candidatus Heimdallarchaeota archaeon]|nr:hypothetical protein [Candidatus Heimdallarchaeota archaeon]MCK4876096.1 hypothetical protein [Candidatus Heimdallarchaeota archaeon]
MEPKEMAEKAIEMVKNKKTNEIVPFIVSKFDDEKERLKALISVQIQMKEIGGGYPPVGEQIKTIDEIITYSEKAINYALEKGNNLTAGILNHNVASFCFPNMDDGVDERLVKQGYSAAVNDFEIRKKIGDKGPMLWAKWLVGVAEFIKGETEKGIKTLDETAKLAQEDPETKSIESWSKLMIGKFYFKSDPSKRDLAIEVMEEVKEEFTSQEDKWGLETLEGIIKTYF